MWCPDCLDAVGFGKSTWVLNTQFDICMNTKPQAPARRDFWEGVFSEFIRDFVGKFFEKKKPREILGYLSDIV